MGGHARATGCPRLLRIMVMSHISLEDPNYLVLVSNETMPNNISLEIIGQSMLDRERAQRLCVNFSHLPADQFNLFVYFFDLFRMKPCIFLSLYIRLGLGHQAPLTLKQESLPPLLQVLVQKFI
jgi:hypothetical protein